ncbi:hypothetical protein RvY_11304 [Ramazzottius varieornatus]|uniref:RFX-type winged-helix domain-containing protein n=1 Tax=Ramazzottius varieornatus TaxID=947166 RepID=A0A1D1VHR3_RAMVA|nr:hypothetical protein RvY_11304 [Ramazzottius varieornatus]
MGDRILTRSADKSKRLLSGSPSRADDGTELEAEKSKKSETGSTAKRAKHEPNEETPRLKDIEPVDPDEGQPSESIKQLFLRRQPRRFAHTKCFSNGVADRATADWLKEHFHTKRGSLVPKGFLCDRYEEFCQVTGRKPMNNATLGRFIRGVFRGLETRRLGARQQSRYFYNNLGVKPTSSYVQLMKAEKRPSYVRRNRVKTSQEKARNDSDPLDDAEFPRRLESTFSSAAFPVYAPDIMHRRTQAARLRLSNTKISKKTSLNEVLSQLDAAGYADVMAFAEVCTAGVEEFNEGFRKSFGESEMATKHLAFVVDLSAHFMEVFRSVVKFDFESIPTLIKSFWETAVEAYKTELEDAAAQSFVEKFSLEMHEKLLGILLEEFKKSPPHTHDYLVLVLSHLTSNYAENVAQLLGLLSVKLHNELLRIVLSFCTCLQEGLRLQSLTVFSQQVLDNERASFVLRKSIGGVFEAGISDDPLVCSLPFCGIFQAGLRCLGRLSDDGSPTDWVRMCQEQVDDLVDREKTENVHDCLQQLRKLKRDWITFLTVSQQYNVDVENSPEGSNIIQGMFDFLVSVVGYSIDVAVQKRLGLTSLQFCLKKAVVEENVSKKPDATEPFSSWWPSFVKAACENEPEAVAEDIGGKEEASSVGKDEKVEDVVDIQPVEEGRAETVADKKGVEDGEDRMVPEVPSTSNKNDDAGVRVSNRAGKGRNRWLQT